jgi:hypothetical protein
VNLAGAPAANQQAASRQTATIVGDVKAATKAKSPASPAPVHGSGKLRRPAFETEGILDRPNATDRATAGKRGCIAKSSGSRPTRC